MKTYIYFKSGNVYQIDPDTVRDDYGLANIIDRFKLRPAGTLQATIIRTDGTTGQIIFHLSDVEGIEQTR